MYRHPGIPFLTIVLAFFPCPFLATAQSDTFNPLEELRDVRIQSVSKREENLLTAAAAIDVLTEDDIRRSMALTLPETLRDAVGLHVANATGPDYAISARGLNSVNANKMEVLIDGRSIYSPLFSGVYWDTQDTILEDLDRIEVIRSPGAALWGPNAVNGVINIYTKPASQTQGAMVSAAGGIQKSIVTSARYGFEINQNTHARIYGKFFTFDHVRKRSDLDPSSSGWEMGRAGFRIDSQSLPQTNLTLIGEVYSNTLDIYSGSPNALDGGHITGRMVHEFDNQSSLTIQSYFEHSNRIYFFYSDEQRETYDISASYNFNLYERHKVVVGAGLRSSSDETGAFPFLEFLPPSETFRTFNVYFSDEIAISPDRFYLTVGAMLVDNTYINWELQPTIRVRFHPNSASTVWAAVSRATRIPARVDTGLVLGSGNNRIYGSRNYESEELLSYELGYRFQPLPNLFFDVSAFHSTYDELRTLEPHPDLPGNFIFGNMLEGTIHGGEALIFYTPAYWLKFELSGSWVSKSFNYKAGSNATGTPNEGVDPTFISTFRTAIELPYQLEADFSLRYTDDVPGVIRDHLALDVRLSWAPSKDIEIAIVGRNLLEHYHTEVDMSVARSIYGKIVARF